MSVFTDAQVAVLVADHIAIDQSGKVTALGAFFTVSGFQSSGMSAPQFVLVVVTVPPRHVGEEFSLSLELRDLDADTAVMVNGPSGQLEALRVQQLVKIERPSIPGLSLPPNMPANINVSLGFPNGLPLQMGRLYGWRVEIDAQTRPGWLASFAVAAPPPPPVFGGMAGPAGIPGLAPPSAAE